MAIEVMKRVILLTTLRPQPDNLFPPPIQAVCRKTVQEVNRDSGTKSVPKNFRKNYMSAKIGNGFSRFQKHLGLNGRQLSLFSDL